MLARQPPHSSVAEETHRSVLHSMTASSGACCDLQKPLVLASPTSSSRRPSIFTSSVNPPSLGALLPSIVWPRPSVHAQGQPFSRTPDAYMPAPRLPLSYRLGLGTPTATLPVPGYTRACPSHSLPRLRRRQPPRPPLAVQASMTSSFGFSCPISKPSASPVGSTVKVSRPDHAPPPPLPPPRSEPPLLVLALTTRTASYLSCPAVLTETLSST